MGPIFRQYNMAVPDHIDASKPVTYATTPFHMIDFERRMRDDMEREVEVIMQEHMGMDQVNPETQRVFTVIVDVIEPLNKVTFVSFWGTPK